MIIQGFFTVHSKQHGINTEKIISCLLCFFLHIYLSGHQRVKLEEQPIMFLAEKLAGGCNSVVYFVIALKGTGEEPKTLRWVDFSFSNLIVFFFFSF